MVDDSTVKAIWGNSSMGYSFQSSNGASGGLLTVWTAIVFKCGQLLDSRTF